MKRDVNIYIYVTDKCDLPAVCIYVYIVIYVYSVHMYIYMDVWTARKKNRKAMNNEHLWNNSKSDESDQWFYILCASDLNLLMKFLIAVNICWQKKNLVEE